MITSTTVHPPAASKKRKASEENGVESTSSSLSSSSMTGPTTNTLELAHSAGVTGTWRDTLFVWCGNADVAKNTLTWKGAWVGVDSATMDGPKWKANRIGNTSSLNTFTVTGNRTSTNTKNGVCFEKTEYLLDNGDGLELHLDPAYELCVKVTKLGHQLVTGAGSNEFGHFICVGRFQPYFSQPNNGLGRNDGRLILARRYVEDGDARSFMNCMDVMNELEGSVEIYNMDTYEWSMPWKDKICRCDLYMPSKEQKEMFKERKRKKKNKKRRKQ